jgi:uridine kinase
MNIQSYSEFVTMLHQLDRKVKTLLLAVDGYGASGKSTFAKSVAVACLEANIVQMDDFYLPSSERLPREIVLTRIGADFDWERLQLQVIMPLCQNKPGCYQRYDWGRDALAEWHEVPVGGIVIVEGCYSMQAELLPLYDFSVWVDCPRQLRLERGIARDGEKVRELWEKYWMPAEDFYISSYHPEQKANLVIDGSGMMMPNMFSVKH